MDSQVQLQLTLPIIDAKAERGENWIEAAVGGFVVECEQRVDVAELKRLHQGSGRVEKLGIGSTAISRICRRISG